MHTAGLPKLTDSDFRCLQQMMLQASGIRMTDTKRTMMAGRLMGRLRVLQLNSYAEYIQIINNPAEQEERRLVIDLLTTNETYFLREPQHFQLLGEWLATPAHPYVERRQFLRAGSLHHGHGRGRTCEQPRLVDLRQRPEPPRSGNRTARHLPDGTGRQTSRRLVKAPLPAWR